MECVLDCVCDRFMEQECNVIYRVLYSAVWEMARKVLCHVTIRSVGAMYMGPCDVFHSMVWGMPDSA